MQVAHPTRHWHALPDGKVQCDVCPRHCQLSEGQRGLCFVRAREGGAVVLTTFGRSSGYCVDPIEKKPLAHFLPGTPVLSFGTAGCNLTCRFCQNWDISKSRDVDTLADAAPPEAIARAAEELRCRSVAFTYNDPVIFLEYADRDGARVPRPRHPLGGGDGRLRLPRAARRALRRDGRDQRRSQGVRRGLLPQCLRRPSPARARDARVPGARHARVARGHDAA